MAAGDNPHQVVMFMSADVVGSTAFKASAQAAGSDWLEAFATLFRELPLIFIGKVAETFMEFDDVPESGVWKVMGDEVIFVALPTSLEQAAGLICAFSNTVAAYDRRLAQRWPLRIRGSCWAAELGRRNRMIEIPEMFGGSSGQPYRDFLGPDIDTGFRLSAYSGHGEVIVSPNLVEPIAASNHCPELCFHHIGYQPLKGVIGGQPFPLVLASTCGPFAEARSSERAETPRQQLSVLLENLRRDLFAAHGVEMSHPTFQ